jgi:hypothetical protein
VWILNISSAVMRFPPLSFPADVLDSAVVRSC